jgi:hypothetical protein
MGFLIDRINNVWDYGNMWIVGFSENNLIILDEGLKILSKHVTPLIDKAIPEGKITVSIWLISKQLIIIFDAKYNYNKEFYEEMAQKLNKERNKRYETR